MMRFSKSNPTKYPDALYQEAKGLTHLKNILIQNSIEIYIPEVYTVNDQQMTLEYIHQLGGSTTQWQKFGQALAQLHQIRMKQFGWHENNYIGMNTQNNTPDPTWGRFFFRQRLLYQAGLIRNLKVRKTVTQELIDIKQNLIEFLNTQCQFPSLLHGDLWSGNVMFDTQKVCLIDPAIYCGDAETDVAMTELFGGFPPSFYQSYAEVTPLSKQYPIKKTIYNLYHQLNHFNLFGQSYWGACAHALETIKHHFKPNK